MLLKNKKIVVIGGTGGIGLSATRAFANEGACVVATGIDSDSCRNLESGLRNPESGLRNSEAELRASETKHHASEAEIHNPESGPQDNVRSFVADAAMEGSAEKAIEHCKSVFGGFDGLYHVAGGSGRRMGDGPLHELTLAGWNKTLELNLTSLMLSNRAAIREWLSGGQSGTILNMGSVLGFSPSPHFFSTHAYAAAKAAIAGYTRSVAAYYAKDNIRINVIAPGLIKTQMSRRAAGDSGIMDFIKTKQPLDGGRIGMPDDLDGAACYFMSDQSRFTTGQILNIDGGWEISEGQY